MWPIGTDSFDWVFVGERVKAPCQNRPIVYTLSEITMARPATVGKNFLAGPNVTLSSREPATVWQDIHVPCGNFFSQRSASKAKCSLGNRR